MASLKSVNVQLLAILKDEFDIAEVRAIKALYLTENKGVDEALEWLEKHQNDPDIDIPLVIVSNSDGKTALVHEVDFSKTENPPQLKESISQELLEKLLELGYALIPAEKCLFRCPHNNSIEQCVEWLTQKASDPDFAIPYSADFVSNVLREKNKPKLTQKEIEEKALALQQKIHLRRVEKEKEEARQKEKDRIANTKLLQEAQNKMQENMSKAAMEAAKREREDNERAKEKQRQALINDYRERFGCDPPANYMKGEDIDVSSKSIREQLTHYIRSLKSHHSGEGDVYASCVKTLIAYIGNTKKGEAYMKIKKENKAFQERVAPFPEAIQILKCVGFEDKGNFLVINGSPDGFLVDQAVRFLGLLQ